ncbi:MAG: tetratricopeptide repeat protein [Anaerolineales bacterium]
MGCRFDRLLNPALPTFTPTVNVPPTPTIPPTPTPIPTPEPGVRIKSGDMAFFNGDWDLALREYAQALENTTENEVKSAALLGLGRTYLKNNQLNAALETLNTGILTYPDSPHRALMFFALAQTHEALNQPLEDQCVSKLFRSQVRVGRPLYI